MGKKSSMESYKAARRSLDLLGQRYPQLFFFHSPPLARGIHEAIIGDLGEAVPREDVRIALKLWCNGERYLRSQKAGAERIGLKGPTGDVVTPEEAEAAHSRLATRREAKRSRQAAPEVCTAGAGAAMLAQPSTTEEPISLVQDVSPQSAEPSRRPLLRLRTAKAA